MPDNDSLNFRDNRFLSFEKIREENQRLKEEVYRLREESREKDALISTLESQVSALVVAGRESNKKAIDSEQETDYDIESHIDSVEEEDEVNRRNSVIQNDQMEMKKDSVDIESHLTMVTERIAIDKPLHKARDVPSLHSLQSQSSVSASLSPPRRSTIEMKHPPAPTREPSKTVGIFLSKSRKNCFQAGTAAIKALPRELSIENHSNLLNDDENDDDGGDDWEQKQQYENYDVENTEFIDAYNSRGIYSGTVQRATQMPHGKGKMVYHKGGRAGGRYYEGDWHVGHWHGYGVIRDADGSVYKGQVVNDLKEGIGSMQFTDGRIFRGEFRQDEAFEGTMSYIDGAQYEGELHHGNRHGFGIYRFSDGSFYEGESVMNLFEGKGKMTWRDGGWYQGDWSRGEIHGFGEEYRPDGSLRHDGRWIKGVPIRTKDCRR